METGDIVNELSSSSIVEDDLNGIFSSLEPLEDPKDDMFFFGGKDLLQKVRDKNPANTSIPVHRSNAPNRPLPSNIGNHLSDFSNVVVPTATCDPQPSLAPLAHHDKPQVIGISEAKNMSPAAIASASASVMYLDNYLAATNTNTTNNKYPITLTPAPPPLATVHDKPHSTLTTAKTHHHASILRKPSHKASTHKNNLSKSHPPTYTYAAPPIPTSADPKLSDSNPLHHSTSSVTNLNLTNPHHNLSNPTSSTPLSPPSTNFPNLSGSGSHYAIPNNSTSATKRNRASYLKGSNELKHSRIIYNPNMPNITNTSANSINNIHHHNNNLNTINNSLHHSSELNSSTVMTASDANPSLSESNPLANSGTIARNVAIESTESILERNNNYHNINHNNGSNHNNNVHIKQDTSISSHRPNTNIDYAAYSTFNPYFPFHGVPAHGFYPANVPIPNDPSMAGPEPVYNPRPSEPQVSFDPATEAPAHPVVNPSNDLYSNLYLYSFNNNIYPTNNTNSNSNTYPRPPQPVPDMNSPYNLYNYSNLYMNSLYGYPTYPVRQYSAPAYHSHKSASYENQTYRNGSDNDENYEDDEDYRADGKYSKSYSKRSKRRSDDDEYRKPSRKSKSRNRSKRKQPPIYEDSLPRDSTELSAPHTISSELPKGEGASPSTNTPPLSPAHNNARRAKSSANLFENTPKIKIGDVQGGNAKISKLGKKLLEAVHLDWRAHTYAQGEHSQNIPSFKTEDSSETMNQPSSVRNQPLESQVSSDPPTTWNSSSDATSESSKQKPVEEKAQVFTEYDTVPERKTELLYFVANNIESLLTMPTKIEITLNDFKSSALGAKVRQRLEVLTAIKQAKELGLILEDQFVTKQQQFLDAFSFGLDNSEKKAS